MDEADDVVRRVGVAWRELRRGAAMSALRGQLFGEGADALTPAQFDALELLVQQGPWRMQELAEALRVDASTASRLVQRLVDAALAARAGCGEDGRGVSVEATAAGVSRYERIARGRREVVSAILSSFEVPQRRELAELLEQMVAALDAFAEREVRSG